MPAIFLQTPLPLVEQISLVKEFSQYDFMVACKTPEEWSRVEVLFGMHLKTEELQMAQRLRWIHSTSADIEGLSLDDIQRKGNILVSMSKGQNVSQIAEFVIGSILAFAKQLFHWPYASHDPGEFWQWPLKETMWSLNKKRLLQVGLGEVGTAVVKMANSLGMKSWGMRRERSFHPYCQKTFSLTHLHSLLPVVDVVVLALPRRGRREILFKKAEFELMKNDSIFIVVGSGDYFDEEALIKAAAKGKFRGIHLDAFSHLHPAQNSPLWNLPNTILTPSVASSPESEEHMAFRLFRQNLRVFSQGKINEMKNLILS